MAKYSYTKDVAGFDTSQLTYEIEQNQTIITDLDYIDFTKPDLDIYFDGTLSGAEETELNSVVSSSPNANIPMPREDRVGTILCGTVACLELSNNITNPTYQLTCNIGSCRDSTGIYTIHNSGNLTIDITHSGANGLDTGSESSSTWYAVHLIADTSGTNSVAGLLSLSPTSPTLPNGYNVFRRIGWVRNSLTSDFLDFAQRGSGSERSYYHLEGPTIINALSNGSATTWTDIDLSSLVPSTSMTVFLNIGFTATLQGSVGDRLFLRMKGASKQAIVIAPGEKNVSTFIVPLTMNTSSDQIIQYQVTNSDNQAGIWVYGWKDEL